MKTRSSVGAAAALLLCAVLAACSEAAPRLSSLSLRLTYGPGGAERLSFFALVDDEDGIRDLEELHLLHDESQLYWTLTEKDWLVVERTGETWIGSHALAMPDGGKLPRGEYRAVLADKGGSRAERSVSLGAPAVGRYAYPALTVSGGTYRILSSYPENSLVAYDASGARGRVFVLKSKEGRLSDLALDPSVRSVALWAEDAEAGVGALTEPVAVGGGLYQNGSRP